MPRKKTEKYQTGLCTVIITEKPDAATRIAQALAEGKPMKKEKRGAYWYEFKRGRQQFVVVPAVGHIFSLDTIKDRSGWKYPAFDVEWSPSFNKKGSEFSKKYFYNIEEAVKCAKDFVIATDYDTEGSVIGYNVLRFLCKTEDAKRMKFSTLTRDELVKSYENISQHLDYGQVESGLTRHYLDFFWGINLTRALTLAMKSQQQHGFALLSTGRVQGPTLAMLFEKEIEIRNFKPKQYWQLQALCKADNSEILAEYEKSRIWDEGEAKNIFEGSKQAEFAEVRDIKKRQYRQPPPPPFNTTELQAEAYSIFKFSPTQTMQIAESLYQAGVISYPRSSSQKLPPEIGWEKIIKSLARLKNYAQLCHELLKSSLQPVEGSRTDPAHPAIYPTAEVADPSRLTAQQKKIYDLIVRRFLAVFAGDAVRESVNVTLDVNGNNFVAVGKSTVDVGWIDFYKPYAAFEEQLLPELKIGQRLAIIKIEMLTKQTESPARYSQGSIVKEMEKRNLGTRATRAEILQTLYDRGYVIGKSIQVTKLGETVTKVLKDFCPNIISEELTRHFEKEMEEVYEDKKKREEVVEEAKKILVELLEDFKTNEEKIGKKLLNGLLESRKDQYRLGKCPNCGGELRVIKSAKSGKRFAGCGGYPKCRTAFPLPQFGFITPLGKECPVCSLPTVRISGKGRRPFIMCINHKCKTKEEWNRKKEKTGSES